MLLEADEQKCGILCSGLASLSVTNEILCFSDAEKASQFLKEHYKDVFVVLQNFSSPGLQLHNTRNMVYMHEKFNIPEIAYMFLIHPLEDKNRIDHTFIHCYYRFMDNDRVNDVFALIINFWKAHTFPARLNRVAYYNS